MVEHPNEYSIWKVNKVECNYSRLEWEYLETIFSLQKFKHYILEIPFLFFTDCQDLKYLVNKPIHHGNIFHWILLFQEFDFEIIIRQGKKNAGPYNLSRLDIREYHIGINDDILDVNLFKM